MVLKNILKIILLLSSLIRTCDSNLIKTNHNLGLGLSLSSLENLCKKLDDPKITKKCNIVSCIGANNWKQRFFVENNFGLDPTKSSTISGPLKPRNNLWEHSVQDGYNLLLDSEIPNFENEIKSAVNNKSIVNLSALSKCILIYLNEDNFDLNNEEITLNQNVKMFFEQLSKRLDLELGRNDKNSKDIYIVLPDFNSFQKKVKPNKSQIKSLESNLKHFFPKMNMHVNHFDTKFTVSKYFDSPSNINIKDVVDVLKSFNTPNNSTQMLVDYVRTKCFENFTKFVDDSLERSLKGEKIDKFAAKYHTQLFDSKVSFYTLVMDQLGRNIPTDFTEPINAHNAKLCLERLIKNLENDIKTEFAKYFTEHRKKLDINLVVDQFIHKFKTQMKSILPFMSESESNASVKDTVSRLEEYMYHMNELYTEFPNKHDSKTDLKKSFKSLKNKIKFNKRFHGIIQLVGLIRDRGSGNKRGLLNYHHPPFLLTLGYANDREIFDDGSGTGVMASLFKFQPILHLKIRL
ncbi:hypothetical protein TpMuguga_01g00048 [Theileria parva strain Muguga]|uniref:uncharacterized protein n=1 Tax=Theileria parva strain Muguga TaxID=333668 RepID=UPI001C61A2F1|nr:uncharacterized protein TpMuguga_01g00048 [Theileria parva strain Muguga]EAN33292.2 hypothetical protein TpMuguga_01g00048 [Theileria parva strain Muguga]